MGVVSCGTTMLDQGVFENIGAVTWDTTVKTSGFTAVSGNGYFCNTTSAAFTVTLPSSPSAGDIVGIKDYANTADTNNITIGRNSSPIQGDAADFIINTEGRSVLLVYVDGTKGWLVTSASQASDISQQAFFITATGGTITTSGDFKIHTFTGPGTFTVCSVGNPAGSDSVDYLVVAGGGSGGFGSYRRGTGGGGAGGYRTTFPSPAGVIPVSVTGYPITVGAGGGGGTSSASGSPSIFSSITSTGGGKGGATNDGGAGPGSPGGSGGGVAQSGTAGAGNTPPVSPPQGFSGGCRASSPGDDFLGGSGGGGSGGVGSALQGTPASPDLNGGAGGVGTANSISGSSVTYGVGGKGGPYYSCGSSSGTANTGNAGSGGAAFQGGPGPTGPSGSGGSGIVVIRYKYQ